MFKSVLTLFRGAAHDAEQAFTDRNALALLRQQMRDATAGVNAARRAVAIAIAQNQQEASQHEKLLAQLADLEERTIDAIEQGKGQLAEESAQTIALMEAERDTSALAQTQFATEIKRLKANVQKAEMKLRELQRGQRLATATDKAQRLRATAPTNTLSSLHDAEETLQRLRQRQTQLDLTDEALSEMSATGNPDAVTEKLAAAGCGKPLTTSADDVLERLKKKAATKSTDQTATQTQEQRDATGSTNTD